MANWDAARESYEKRGPSETESADGTPYLTREGARIAVHSALKRVGLLEADAALGDPADPTHAHVEVDGVRFYVGPGGILWGSVTTGDGEHSWDMAIRELADVGELLQHKEEMDAGVHPGPRAEGPLNAEAKVGE